jgi:hypothetical protein
MLIADPQSPTEGNRPGVRSVRFAASHVEAEACIRAIERKLRELSPAGRPAEIRLVQVSLGDPVKLVFQRAEAKPVLFEFPADWFWSPACEEAMTAGARELLGAR